MNASGLGEQGADAVHAKGSYVFMQILALGRAAVSKVLAEENPDFPYVSSSDVPMSNQPEDVPRPLTVPGARCTFLG